MLTVKHNTFTWKSKFLMPVVKTRKERDAWHLVVYDHTRMTHYYIIVYGERPPDFISYTCFCTKELVFCAALFLNGDWLMQRGQTPMFACEIIYTPYFYLQKRNHVSSINEFSSKTHLSLIDRMTKQNN